MPSINLPYLQHCGGCRAFRQNCKYKDGFCLLLTRRQSLLAWWDQGGQCPEGRWPDKRGQKEQSDDGELVSVIILAKKEPLLQKTIDNLQETARGPIEFIVVLDGPETEPPHSMDNLCLIRHATPQGRRPSTNEAAEKARGKYLFHVDAHVKTDTEGWDVLLKRACADNKTMVIPSLDKLVLPDYRGKGRRFGHKYVTRKMKDAWSGVKPSNKIEPTICGNGMGWFLTKDYFDAFGGCDEAYGRVWGNFGLEWGLKVWLTDPDGRGPGQVLLHRDVVFAHMWKNSVGYPTPGAAQGRERLQKFVSWTADNQVRPFSHFEKTMPHLIPLHKSGDKAPLLATRPEVTAVMNTNGLFPELLEEAVESFNRQDYPNKKLLIVSAHKDPLRIKHKPDNIEVHNIKPFDRFPQQIQYALKQVKTPYFCIMDSDDIFFQRHISQLVDCAVEAKRRQTTEPFYVCVPKAWEQWAGKDKKQRHRGWWCCLYQRPTDAQIDEAFESFLEKTDKDTGSDLHFIKRSWWTRIDFEKTEITVLHRLGVGLHIGHHRDSHAHYQDGVRHSQATPLKEIVPQWREDYEAVNGYEKHFHIKIKNHLGDAVCAEPAIRNLKANNPQSKITVYSKFPDLFQFHPSIDHSLPLEQCTKTTHNLKVRRGLHLVDWLTPGAQWSVSRRPQLYTHTDISQFGIDFKIPTVILSARTHAVHKRWNKEKWVEFVEWLRAEGYQTVQVGIRERNIHCDYNLTGHTTITQLIELCRQSVCYVGIDAGVQHVAVGAGTPAVVLFGPADPDTVFHDLTTPVLSGSCRDCWTAEKLGRKCPRGDAMCMFDISVDDVKGAFLRHK